MNTRVSDTAFTDEQLREWAEHECGNPNQMPVRLGCSGYRSYPNAEHRERRSLARALLETRGAVDQERYFRDLAEEQLADERAAHLKAEAEREAENARLRAVLERIAHNIENGESFSGSYCAEIAREALGCEKDE